MFKMMVKGVASVMKEEPHHLEFTSSASSLVWVTGGLMPEWGVEGCF
jgi:hypothetical protein